MPRSCITHEEAISSFPHWMAAVAQAFSQWVGSWMARDYPAFREWSRVVSAQSWAMVRGTMVTGSDGQSDPLLQVYADHPAVGNIMGWPRDVLPVFQQPLCNLPILAVAVVFDVGTLWLYDRQLRRVIPAVTEWRSMAVLVGSKQLARVQGDDAQGHVTEAMFFVPEADDNLVADARHTLDTLGLASVVEARTGGQRLVLASATGPGLDGVDVTGEIVRDYGWEFLTHGTHSRKVARWPRLLESLPVMFNGQPILRPVSAWDEARRSLLSCATVRALRVLFSVSMKRAVMCGRNCGRSAVMIAASGRGPCSHSNATGARRRRRFGFINVPPPHSAGLSGSVPVGGGLRRDGRYGTLDRCPQVPGRQSRVT